MFKTYPEHEVGLPPIFGASQARHWQIVELRGRAMLFHARFQTRNSAGDIGPVRRILLADASALERAWATGLFEPAYTTILALELHAPDPACRQVTALLMGDEPDAAERVYVLDLASGERCSLSRRATPSGQLRHLRDVFRLCPADAPGGQDAVGAQGRESPRT